MMRIIPFFFLLSSVGGEAKDFIYLDGERGLEKSYRPREKGKRAIGVNAIIVITRTWGISFQERGGIFVRQTDLQILAVCFCLGGKGRLDLFSCLFSSLACHLNAFLLFCSRKIFLELLSYGLLIDFDRGV